LAGDFYQTFIKEDKIMKIQPTSHVPVNNVTTNQNNQVAGENNQNNPAGNPASTFTRNRNVPVDQAAIDRLLEQSRDQTRMFEQLVSSVLNMQTNHFANAFNEAIRAGNVRGMFTNIEVDEATRNRAQELVSDDGFFGVRQTSERLLDFARAYAGDDPVRIERMRNAFERGFAAATRAWGDELPDISQRTRDAVLAGFDDMLANARGENPIQDAIAQ
jgi:hypothetical protein